MKTTERPDPCYIATAAARGHRRWVSAYTIGASGGKVVCINRQLVVLKAGELALQALAPKSHRAMRCIYNFAGPPLAKACGNAFLADIAYLLLKPPQWLAMLVLLILLGRRRVWIDRLYQNSP